MISVICHLLETFIHSFFPPLLSLSSTVLLFSYLEFKYKRRVYKTHHVDERFHRQLHAKANLKRFLGYVAQGSIDKVAKLTEKGLDPNFQVRIGIFAF